MLMLPEIIVVLTAFTVLLADLFIPEDKRGVLGWLAVGGLAIAFCAALSLPVAGGTLLAGRFTATPITWWFNILFLLSGMLVILLSMDLLDGRVTSRHRGMGARGEFYTVLLFTLTGMMFLMTATDLITLYVSLELATIPLFALAAWRRDNVKSGEAGLKYVVLAMVSSSLMLYGLALVYGINGHTGIVRITEAHSNPMLWFAMALVLAGAGAKFTVAPFHFWAADVYEGAPTPITAYLSVASKCTGLAFMFQFLLVMFGDSIKDLGFLIAAIAAVTMTLGNTVAIVQTNIKRFMAFSSISQAGYFFMGFLCLEGPAVPAMLFYMLVYIVSNLGVFAAIIWYANETGREEIAEYRGLSRTNPLMALMMMVCLFSLAGIPPLSGFVGKFFLFSIASQGGYHWLVAVAAVNSTISLYYYLRVVRQMYIEPTYPDAQTLPVTKKLICTETFLFVATVFLGIIPVVYQAIYNGVADWF